MLLASKHERRWSKVAQTLCGSKSGVLNTVTIQFSLTYGSRSRGPTASPLAREKLSRLTQVSDPSGTYSFTYDNLGRLVGAGTQYSFLGGTLANTYGYDAASNRTSFTASGGISTAYSYDTLNRLTSLTDSNTGQFGFGYDAVGRRTSLTRPNGVNTSYSYDPLSRLLSVLHGGGTLPGSTGYTYDNAGNRLTKTAVQDNNGTPVSVLSQYSYDNIYELTQAVVNGVATEGYTYDAVGNRLTSVGPTAYTYNSSNELTSTSTATYTYDNNGNTLSKITSAGTTNYTWDFENRLTTVALPGSAGTVNFRYDPFGRRVYKTSPVGTYVYVYDGDNVVQQLNGAGAIVADYTQGLGVDEPLGLYSGGTASYFHADGLGSTTSLTGTTGNFAASYVYDSFGNLTASTGTITNPFQYTAREFDPESGLYYYRARYYDPNAGRFVSEDPVTFVGGHNFYTYVGNNPTLFMDSSGLAKTCNIPAIGPHSKLPTPLSMCASGSLIDCIVQTESSGDANAKSPKGATGLMQTTTSAVNELTRQGLYQPGMTNMQVGSTYINLLLSYCSNVTAALAAYNAGWPTVNTAGGVPNNGETPNYVKKIDDCLKKSGLSGGVNDSGAIGGCGCK